MHVVNTHAVSYQSKTLYKCLDTIEREKKRKYLNACLNKHRNFTYFTTFVYGLLGFEAEAALKRIASRPVQKWQEPYSRTCGCVKSIVSITLVRATHRFIQGAKVTASCMSVTRPQWEDSAGLHLFR